MIITPTPIIPNQGRECSFVKIGNGGGGGPVVSLYSFQCQPLPKLPKMHCRFLYIFETIEHWLKTRLFYFLSIRFIYKSTFLFRIDFVIYVLNFFFLNHIFFDIRIDLSLLFNMEISSFIFKCYYICMFKGGEGL